MGIAGLRQGDLEMAREAAGRAVTLMEQVKASAYTHFEAFSAVAEVYLSLGEGVGVATEAAIWQAQDKSIRQAQDKVEAQKLCDSRSRGTTRSGRPAAWLFRGWYNWLDGHPQRAYKHWEKGLVAAKEVGMRYELGRIHLEMGRHAAAGDLAREEHLRQARAIFAQMGANYQLQRTEAAIKEQPS